MRRDLRLVLAIAVGGTMALIVGIPLGGMISDWLLYAGWWPAPAW